MLLGDPCIEEWLWKVPKLVSGQNSSKISVIEEHLVVVNWENDYVFRNLVKK